jgi:hypothetical protein
MQNQIALNLYANLVRDCLLGVGAPHLVAIVSERK